MTRRRRSARSADGAIPGPAPDLTLLVRHATLKCRLHSTRAATMRGRRSPDNSATTSRPRTS